jgi:hypothetical protein
MQCYEKKSVNRSQIDMKRKTRDIRTWQKHLFLDISSTYIDKHLPVRRSPQHGSILTVVSATSAPPFKPLRHKWNVCHVSRPSCEPLYMANTSLHKQETFLFEYPLHWVLTPTKNVQQNAALRWYILQAWSLFWLMKPASEHAHVRLLPRMSWSWTVLLPIDTHRKPITSITAYFHLWHIYWLSLRLSQTWRKSIWRRR